MLWDDMRLRPSQQIFQKFAAREMSKKLDLDYRSKMQMGTEGKLHLFNT